MMTGACNKKHECAHLHFKLTPISTDTSPQSDSHVPHQPCHAFLATSPAQISISLVSPKRSEIRHEFLYVLGVFGEPLTRLALGLVAEEIPKDHGTLEVASDLGDLGLHSRWEVQLAQDGVREVRQQAAFLEPEVHEAFVARLAFPAE